MDPDFCSGMSMEYCDYDNKIFINLQVKDS